MRFLRLSLHSSQVSIPAASRSICTAFQAGTGSGSPTPIYRDVIPDVFNCVNFPQGYPGLGQILAPW